MPQETSIKSSLVLFTNNEIQRSQVHKNTANEYNNSSVSLSNKSFLIILKRKRMN